MTRNSFCSAAKQRKSLSSISANLGGGFSIWNARSCPCLMMIMMMHYGLFLEICPSPPILLRRPRESADTHLGNQSHPWDTRTAAFGSHTQLPPEPPPGPGPHPLPGKIGLFAWRRNPCKPHLQIKQKPCPVGYHRASFNMADAD